AEVGKHKVEAPDASSASRARSSARDSRSTRSLSRTEPLFAAAANRSQIGNAEELQTSSRGTPRFLVLVVGRSQMGNDSARRGETTGDRDSQHRRFTAANSDRSRANRA